MWRSISLRNQINLILGLLFVVWLAADAARLVFETSARASAETESAMRLATDFLATAAAGLKDAPEPERALRTLVAELDNVRHLRVGLDEPPATPEIALAPSGGAVAPRWFRSLISAPNQVQSFPVLLKGGRTESIVVVADPLDEIDEAWTGARDEMLVVAMLAAAAMGAMSVLVGRAVKPLDVAGQTLARLAEGDYAARAEGSGPPEIRNLNTRVNSLGEALEGLNSANGELMERVFDAHDQERRVIAHELHDELGPHLFGLRASAALLAKKSAAIRPPRLLRALSQLRSRRCRSRTGAFSPIFVRRRSRNWGFPRRSKRSLRTGVGQNPQSPSRFASIRARRR